VKGCGKSPTAGGGNDESLSPLDKSDDGDDSDDESPDMVKREL
jgi:hypothetical protein